ncbi:MAG TPA: hypothetical protein VLF61_02080, partial [Rhabdochlamydiaceae bacterium]|nr:hypothetical protein [Rhabdochlamydiaceae bacterium]
GKIFAEKLSIYFQYADTLYLYWSDDLLVEEVLAATFDKGQMTVDEGCSCTFHKFISKFYEDREALQLEGKTIPSWEELVQIYTSRFQR